MVKPVTLNAMGADVNVPLTFTVWPSNVHEPVKSINELQDSPLMMKVLAKVNHKLEGTIIESDGSKVTLRDVAESKALGEN